MTDKCFLIHGHNDILKLEVARLIEKELKKDVIILHEQTSKGLTIVEKFEANSDVDFAIALWTYDDDGKSKGGSNLNPRARQNVILETGYFFGRLGRDKVFVLYESGVEIPSDYNGMVYISIQDNWKFILIKEVNALYSKPLNEKPHKTSSIQKSDNENIISYQLIDRIDEISNYTKERLKKIVQLFEMAQMIRTNEIEKLLGISKISSERYLQILKQYDIIEFKGSPKIGGYCLKKYQ